MKGEILGIIIICGTMLNLIVATGSFLNPYTPTYRPAVYEGVARDGKIGTYVYDHSTVANDVRYMDDIALMADRVLIDIAWRSVMDNDSTNPFDMVRYQFFDEFFSNLSARGLEIVVQFSPTRSPPPWLNIEFGIPEGGYRIEFVPTEPEDYERFETQLLRYVNYSVNYFKNAPYLVSPIEWVLADEPKSDTWAPILQSMYDLIKIQDPQSIVSTVAHRSSLYESLLGSCDMFTIDPYASNSDLEYKIKLAYELTDETKPVRVIISGMARDNAYYMIRQQMILSWFLGANDVWFWSYNARWDGLTNEWYVTLYNSSGGGPIHTERAVAVMEGKADIARLAQIEQIKYDGSTTAEEFRRLAKYENDAYAAIMGIKFEKSDEILSEALAYIAGL